MKKTLAYIFLVLLFYNVTLGQTQKLIPPDIKKAMISGNSKQLATHFSQSVELLIKNTEDVYSKAQAELILKDFFKKNIPSEFEVEIEGESDGIKYTIGNLNTSSGKYKVYLAYQNIKGRATINRLNISKYN